MAEQWISDLTKELERRQPPRNSELHTTCIYRVPKILTDVNSQAYEPKLASFGPYHHGCRHLRPMEQHKHRALLQFLRRIAEASKTPNDVFVAMKDVEPDLLRAYDALRTEDEEEGPERGGRQRRRDWVQDKDEFIKLMISDGCFVLEVMLAEMRSAAGEEGEYDSHDPVFGAERKNYVMPYLKQDMLLIENQLPLLVLSTLADIEGSGIGDVNNLIIAFYNIDGSLALSALAFIEKSRVRYNLPNTRASLENRILSAGHRFIITEVQVPKSNRNYGEPPFTFHILDLYRKTITEKGDYLPSYDENVQSATELRDAGVSFHKSGSKSFRDISFRGGHLWLPQLVIDDMTESLLLNLMAFERLHPTAGNEVTAYVFFMCGLVNSTDDVALLRREEILMGWVGCDDNITSMFNRITKEATLVVLRKDVMMDVKMDVNRALNVYCKKRAHRWRASFVHMYLMNPWVFTSLVGGLLLLSLTILQTLYTIMSYYHG